MNLYEIIQQLQSINNNKNHFLVGQLRDALNEMAVALQRVADNLIV
jgi:hypothetical protein